jgi:membrane protease YdiL (CAAX protease family)
VSAPQFPSCRLIALMFPFPTVNFTAIPWDFVLILAILATLVPWRGAVRVKRLLAKPDLTSADRLSLYGTTIFSQWIIVAIVAWRALSRGVTAGELAIDGGETWQVALVTILMAALLCSLQVVSLTILSRMPPASRGSLFAITEKIMPRAAIEMCVYTGLVFTAGVSEEFLYRGFVYASFARIFPSIPFSSAPAMILSSLWFSMAHLYQGKRGVITTFAVGIIFTISRVWTHSLIPAITSHIGIDLAAGVVLFNIAKSENLTNNA